jgi:hypothetical protein
MGCHALVQLMRTNELSTHPHGWVRNSNNSKIENQRVSTSTREGWWYPY